MYLVVKVKGKHTQVNENQQKKWAFIGPKVNFAVNSTNFERRLLKLLTVELKDTCSVLSIIFRVGGSAGACMR